MLLTDLFEAVKPGDVKDIKLKIANAEKALRDIADHEYKMKNISGSTVIPGTEKEFEDLKVAYQTYIENLKAELEKAKQVQKKDPLESYMKAIAKNCKTVVKTCQTTGKLLYRGTRSSNAPAFYGKPYDERRAKDSDKMLNDAFNYALRMDGVEARRDNSIFTTTNKNFAEGFGNELYIVFPRDPFNFTWSDKIKDLILNSETMGDMVNQTIIEMIMNEVWNNEETKQEFIKNYAYQRGIEPERVEWDPKKINENENSRYIFSKYTMYDSFKSIQPIIPKLSEEYKLYDDFKYWTSAETIIENFGLHVDEDLEGAFNRRFEITVRGEYYAIHSRYEKQVKKYLGIGEPKDDINF